MQEARWKRLLSHFMEMHIESTSSEHNPNLHVVLSKGRYQLCTDNAIYSFADLYDNFNDAFKKIRLDQYPIKNVLVLGLGLGSIPLILEKTYQKNYHYTTVEIDEEVNYLAHKYTLPELKSDMTMVCADAFSWVMTCEEKFDLITMDVFLDDVIPEHFEQQEFLSNLKGLLAQNGILMYNRLALHKEDIEKCEAFYKNNFKPIFEKGGYLEVKGNWILVNDDSLLI